jgi:hypothetical protein
MQTVRKEVQAFVNATERLLAPIVLEALNEDEREIIAMCAQSLVERYPTTQGSTEENLALGK